MFLLIFAIFIVVLVPVIILGIKHFTGKEIGTDEKILSISFSVIGAILIGLALYYSNLYTESLWFQSLTW